MSRARDDRRKNDRLNYAALHGWPLPERAVITYASRARAAMQESLNRLRAR